MLYGPRILEWNCTMTNVMHKFSIYLSIYFCLTCFGLYFCRSSEAGVQLWQWFKSPGSAPRPGWNCAVSVVLPSCAGQHNRLNHNNLAHRPHNHMLYDIPPIWFVFQVTQKDLRSSLMLADYCQNMQDPVYRIKEWYSQCIVLVISTTFYTIHNLPTHQTSYSQTWAINITYHYKPSTWCLFFRLPPKNVTAIQYGLHPTPPTDTHVCPTGP
jgi:hypothetical protein